MDDHPAKPGFFERLFGRLAGDSPDSPEDILALLRQAREQKIFDEDTQQWLEKIIDFRGLEVRDAMISRAQMDVVKAGDSISRIIAYVVGTTHSRFPVIADDKDNVLGILHAKDLLKYTLNPEQFKLENVLRPAVFVPEGKPLNVLLKEFRDMHNHLAVVVDEYGSISGLVTLEDVIEQILGDIEDEFDEDAHQRRYRNRRCERILRHGLQRRRSEHHRRAGDQRARPSARARRKSRYRPLAIHRGPRRQPPPAHADGGKSQARISPHDKGYLKPDFPFFR